MRAGGGSAGCGVRGAARGQVSGVAKHPLREALSSTAYGRSLPIMRGIYKLNDRTQDWTFTPVLRGLTSKQSLP